ncbi:MAG TPA: porin family protein [Chitinophagaceae bacterium]|nr:porin family protein [Chitinophagaceae bacterium]
MKKNVIAFTLVLSGMIITNVQAQGFHLGIKGGANLDKVNGQSFDDEFKFGYNVGAFAELNFSPMWGIQPELLFNQSTYRTGSDFSDVYPGGVDDVEGKLNYLTVPVLLSFRPAPILSIQAGPQFGIAINQDQHLVNNVGDAFKAGDFALVGGLQLNLSSLRIGGRWVEGLSNVNDYTSTSSWKHQGFQVYVGFKIL